MVLGAMQKVQGRRGKMKPLTFRDLVRTCKWLKHSMGLKKWDRCIWLNGMTRANKILIERNKEG